MTEADTCREFVTPSLVEAGWGALLPAKLGRVFAASSATPN
jgi:hypothetical protein